MKKSRGTVKELKQRIKSLGGRRRRTKQADLKNKKVKAGVWHNLAKKIKAATKKTTSRAEKKAIKAAKTAVAKLSKATGVKYLAPVKKKGKGGAKERMQKAKGVGKKSAKGKKALAKVETRLIDKKKKHQVSQAKKAGQKAAQKNVKRKLARRRRSAGNASPKKVRPLMTKKQVKGELAKQKEYQLAKKGIAHSVKHSRKMYPLTNTRRRAYVARRRRTTPAPVSIMTTEVKDLRKSVVKWNKSWKKAQAAADKINPDKKSAKKAALKAAAKKGRL